MGDFWRAAEAGDLEEVQRLVGHDPSLLNANEHGDWGWTPLKLATWRSRVEVVHWLLDQGAEVGDVLQSASHP
jgi:hypothetical protein